MNGPEHYNEAERLLDPDDNRAQVVDCLRGIGHALLALVKAEEDNSDEIVTMSAALAHLANDVADNDDTDAHVGGLTP